MAGMRSTAARAAQAALLFLALGTAREAHANGAFPASGQVLIDPTKPETMWVATSFGFAKTTDGGESFDIVCEEAIGYSGIFHPHAGITQTGAIFMGLADGLAYGRGDTCAFERAEDLEGLFIVDVSVDPSGRAIALAVPPDGGRAQVWASTDDLENWSPLGALLPDKFSALTLDAAPSDPTVLYVSGYFDDAEITGAVLTSLDSGAQWSSTLIPESDSSQFAPYIGAVDPNEEGTVYVRLNGAQGRLFVTTDFGESFDEVLQIDGFMNGFKLSPDGATAYFGGKLDGLNALDTTTFEVTELAFVAARCITLDGELMYVCGEEAADGFSAGVSNDGGMTFTPFFVDQCVGGILGCAAGTAVHDTCEPGWPLLQQMLGATGECAFSGGGGAGNGGESSSGGGSPDNGGGPPAAGGFPSSGGAGGNDGDGDDGGCSCEVAGSDRGSGLAWLGFGILIAGFGLRRGRSREKNAAHAPSPTQCSDHRRSRRSRSCARAATRLARREHRPR